MNIKHKAALITVSGLFGLFATLFTIAQYPAVVFFALIGGLVFVIYKGVLNYLEHNERFKR
jgi:hypothetical protein